MFNVLSLLYKKEIFRSDRNGGSKKQIDAAIAYIRQTHEVRDVLLSGGDGLLINDNILEYILKNLREIDHVEIIRIGTRAPVVFPQRITENLCTILKSIIQFG